MKIDCIVLIPIYKEKPSETDRISLTQLFKILKDYPMAYIAPESLDISSYSKWDASVIRFKNEYFDGTSGYTKLLLSEDFYLRFKEFEYMLIHQTDALVFSDRLMEFCEMGFDYIGAPVKDYGWDKFHVGNGGLSLRRIEACLEILNNKKKIISEIDGNIKEYLSEAEDLFWGFCGWRKDIGFSVPSVSVAATFSVERDVGRGFRRIPKEGLPFGCHHWTIMNVNTWRPLIEKLGYTFPNDLEEGWDTLETDRIFRSQRFLHYLIRHQKLTADQVLNDQIYSIYGAGRDGRKCMEEMLNLKARVKCVYDMNWKEIGTLQGIKVCCFDHLENNEMLVVSSRKYREEIAAELSQMGLKEGVDFIHYEELLDEMRKKMELVYPGIEGITKPFNIWSSL